ncbi:MAG: glutamate--tRNA ligase [Gemmatimonadota bacterium]
MIDRVRVRFAPSPTGYLHVGGARTALFNWLFARHHRGAYLLRIEDTDRERNDPVMTDVILQSLAWLGLDWDEEVVHQADGLARHQRDANTMLASGGAYRCFCTAEELEQKRAAAGDGYRYDGKCRELSREESDGRAREPHTLRFRVPNQAVSWNDAVHGVIEFPIGGIDDFIILRTDGTPIYNLAVVSDDLHMRITHVIRGDDHVSNTPKQILIYQALGAALPTFAHVPMILGSDGKRLSKRHGATAVGEYQHQGILPEALRNFLALLGWAPGEDREVMSLDQMTDLFSLEGINKKSAVFDTQKLLWMNGQFMNAMTSDQLEPLVVAELMRKDQSDPERLAARGDWLRSVIELTKSRARSITELAQLVEPYLQDLPRYDPAAVEKHWKDPDTVHSRLTLLRERYATLITWAPAALEKVLRDVAAESGVTAAALIHPLRVALIGVAVSPGIFDVLAVLGRELSLRRIDAALDNLRATRA